MMAACRRAGSGRNAVRRAAPSTTSGTPAVSGPTGRGQWPRRSDSTGRGDCSTSGVAPASSRSTLAHLFADVVGVDADRDMVEQAARRVAEREHHEHFVGRDARRRPSRATSDVFASPRSVSRSIGSTASGSRPAIFTMLEPADALVGEPLVDVRRSRAREVSRFSARRDQTTRDEVPRVVANERARASAPRLQPPARRRCSPWPASRGRNGLCSRAGRSSPSPSTT